MSKYNNYINTNYTNPTPLVPGEKILWEAKPKKSAFIINQCLTMMPFALIWLLFDSVFIIAFLFAGSEDMPKEMLFFLIPFFALHLMPVWIWLGNVISAGKKWSNSVYYITDRRIIIQSGFIGIDFSTIYFKDIKNVTLNVGTIDKLLGVGDIHFDLDDSSGYVKCSAFLDIENPYQVYPQLQKIVLDMQTDMEYPNALRPEENPGYNTKYNPENPIKYN